MKKTSKLIASLSMSLLAVGVMAQTPGNFAKARFIKGSPASGNFRVASAHAVRNNGHKVSSVGSNYFLDNLVGDEENTAATFYNWSPYLFLNNTFTVADTGASYNLNSNDMTEVFDTAYDLYTLAYQQIAAPGSMVEIDTITGFVRYENTSGGNDTIWLSVNSVNVNGYPSSTVYGSTYIVVTPTFFPYNTVDSIQEFQVYTTIDVPTTARHGWNFGINMSVTAPNGQDSIALVYYSQGSTACAALGGYYTNEPTTVGVANAAVANVNSFIDGLWWFNSPGEHGNGTELSWPLTSGTYQGYYMNSGTYYWAPLPLVLLYSTCTGDTSQFAVQDVALFPSILIVPAGINNVKANGLAVDQNYPNPFNKTTQISYSLTKSSDVTFSVYDMTGRVLVNNVYTNSGAGNHVINLNANSFSPGVYFYSFNVNGSVITKKMVITE